MPIYEYRCASCQKDSEFMMKISDPTPELCPACGAKGQLSKLLSQTGFILKGGGWYQEGYAGKSNQKTEAPKSESPSSDSSTSTSAAPAAAPASSGSSSSGGSSE